MFVIARENKKTQIYTVRMKDDSDTTLVQSYVSGERDE